MRAFVIFGVVSLEEFDVPVHVGEGVAPFRRRQMGVNSSVVAIGHDVFGTEFDGSWCSRDAARVNYAR